MRIIINVDKAKDAKGNKAVRVRLGYQSSADDELRVTNCGIELYNIIKEPFENGGFQGGVICIEGERK